MKRTVVIIAMLTLLAACNTVEGAGKDVQAGGSAVSNAAQKDKDQ